MYWTPIIRLCPHEAFVNGSRTVWQLLYMSGCLCPHVLFYPVDCVFLMLVVVRVWSPSSCQYTTLNFQVASAHEFVHPESRYILLTFQSHLLSNRNISPWYLFLKLRLVSFPSRDMKNAQWPLGLLQSFMNTWHFCCYWTLCYQTTLIDDIMISY